MSIKPHPSAVWITLRGGSGWGCACMAATLPKVEDDMLRLGLIKFSLDVFQWAYNPGKVAASANTHDRGGVIDVGQYTLEQRRVWAKWGIMMFPRTHAFGWTGGEHGHGVWVGCPHQVEYVQWQVKSGLAGGDGLGSMDTLKGRAWRNFEKPTHTWQQRLTINEGAVRAAAIRTKAQAKVVVPTPAAMKPISFSVTMRAITGTEKGQPSGNVRIMQEALRGKNFLDARFVTGIWNPETGSAFDKFIAAKGIKRGDEGRPTFPGFWSLMKDHGFKAVV